MKKWLNHTFASSTGKTPDFLAFARAFKGAVKKATKESFEVVYWNTGHFYVSAFFRNKTTGKYAYLSIPDVRHFPGRWHTEILVRTAKNEHDYTGGRNTYTPLTGLNDRLLMLTAAPVSEVHA